MSVYFNSLEKRTWCVTVCAEFIVVDLKVAGKLMGVPISERSVTPSMASVMRRKLLKKRWNWL